MVNILFLLLFVVFEVIAAGKIGRVPVKIRQAMTAGAFLVPAPAKFLPPRR